MRRILFALTLCILPVVAIAQDSADETERDRDFLTGFLEDNLSGLGRTVRIDGFAGALSSRATFDQLTIADGKGVWLTIRNGAISWNRSALLGGRVEIEEMSAEEILLPRQPESGRPATEASGFALPELPVAVDIGLLRADHVVLGEELFGAGAEVSLNGQMQLEGGEGAANLSIERTDGKRGTLSLSGSYSNTTREVALDLLVAEEANGIAVSLIGLPGEPPIELAVNGSGVIDNFRADVALRTDGVPRVDGTVAFLTADSEGALPEQRFNATLKGDVSPLFLPEYRDFFGANVSLEAEGRRTASGQMELTRLVLGSKGLDLTGRLVLSPEGLPLEAALTARIGLPDGGDVLLPLAGDQTWVRAGDLTLRYDSERSNGWRLAGSLAGFRRPDLTIGSLTLDGAGTIAGPGLGSSPEARITGAVSFAANQIEATDPALTAALGRSLRGRAEFVWQDGDPFQVSSFDVTGDGYRASGNADIVAREGGLTAMGKVTAGVDDMTRFSALAGRQLGGSAQLRISGSAGLLSGFLDLDALVEGQDLAVGQAELDRLLTGGSRVTASVKRDESGTELRALTLRASTLSAEASGRVGQGASDVTAKMEFSDLGALGPGYSGAMDANARLVETEAGRTITLQATGRDLGVGQAEIDRVLGGQSELTLTAEEQGGRIRLNDFQLSNPQLSLMANGVIEDATRRIDVEARLNNMALLAPGFPGPLTVQGRITEAADGYEVALSGTGPGATSAKIEGRIAQDFATADLAIAGGAQAAIVNPFIAPRNIQGPVSADLRLSGPFRLSSLSGRVAAEGARIVAPTFGLELRGARLAADLNGGQANLSGSATVRGGGSVTLSGQVGLGAPFDGSLSIGLNQVSLRDPELYDTNVSGTVQVAGPLAGGAVISGAVSLGVTEIRIPSTGLGANADLTGLTHINEPAPVHLTRARAGLAGTGGDAKDRGPSYGLDLEISAPSRIFVRGRGLDAEMGGGLRLRGTTENIVPEGQFSLIRGRLDILGKRFTIDEGLVQLQGALTPYVRFAATTESDGITATIVVEGVATEPDIKFLSSPELPEEEVISHLLFGRSLTSLSPFQAAQLASAVATLAGKGGEGIVSKLRKSFGLDDLDVTTDTEGNAALRAGKYLSENIYTDVTIGADGKSEVNLNLDIRKDLTLKGSLGADGQTGIGLYYERDY
ncbi:MAG: translocation/assembly module TamB domain-containing protein [Paracoccaceae bacterium]